eukprot:scaffold280892_cov37-Prasinocladus_malaysianus.AAC.1
MKFKSPAEIHEASVPTQLDADASVAFDIDCVSCRHSTIVFSSYHCRVPFQGARVGEIVIKWIRTVYTAPGQWSQCYRQPTPSFQRVAGCQVALVDVFAHGRFRQYYG